MLFHVLQEQQKLYILFICKISEVFHFTKTSYVSTIIFEILCVGRKFEQASMTQKLQS